MDSTTLYDVVQTTLHLNADASSNALRPQQLQELGVELVDLLTAAGAPTAEQTSALWERGLDLTSLLEGITALHQVLLDLEQPATAQTVLARLPAMVLTYHATGLAAIRHEQETVRSAASQALSEQREVAQRLENLLHEVSTPVVPVYDGILVLPLVGAIDSRRSNEITERLLDSIIRLRAHSIIIDITGVPIVDTVVAQHLLQTAHAAQLLGASVILVGISPEIAQTIVHLGISVGHLLTLSDLQAGIRHALRQHGLAISRISPN